jgi:bifunctional DNase/RNase
MLVRECEYDMESIACNVAGCQLDPVLFLSRVEQRQLQLEQYFCENHARDFIEDLRSTEPSEMSPTASLTGRVAVDVELVAYYKHDVNRPACLYLRELGGNRRICMVIDQYAWSAIIAHMRPIEAGPPVTHTAWADTIKLLDAELQDAILDRKSVADEWWVAQLNLKRNQSVITVTVRPSDAIVLSTIFRAPIFVADDAINTFAITA